MKVAELLEGMLLEAKRDMAIVYNGEDSTGHKLVRSAPDILAPGFDGFRLLSGGTWMYLGRKKIKEKNNEQRTVHELFHSRGGIFITTGQIFKDLTPTKGNYNDSK
jgi:hypothetical protein